ncbi:MAG: hypothetical protein ABSA58_03070 [Acetobacteraceae bacterium]|jgi:hypothetical protein
MLRTVLLVIGAMLLATLLVEPKAAIGPAVIGAVIVLSVLIERYVYKPIGDEPPGAGWNKTEERFADPASGRNVAVYYNPRTGQRRYVAEGAIENVD